MRCSPRIKPPRQSSRGRMLLEFEDIGAEFATTLWLEGLFRHFDNRRQPASYGGLRRTPGQSGSVDREQGVSKAGNPRLRATLIELASLWLRHQPQSALALWFKERFKPNGGRIEDDHRRSRPQAFSGAVEICHRRRRH